MDEYDIDNLIDHALIVAILAINDVTYPIDQWHIEPDYGLHLSDDDRQSIVSALTDDEKAKLDQAHDLIAEVRAEIMRDHQQERGEELD